MPATLEDLKNLTFDGTTIGEKVVEQIGIIGEKLELSYFDSLNDEYVQAYIHPGNMLATLVSLQKKELTNRYIKMLPCR